MSVKRSVDTGRTGGLNVQVIGSDTVDIISVDNVKLFLRVDFADDDYMIGIMIDSAIDFIEGYCGISLRQKTLVATYDTVSTSFELPYGPVRSVTSVLDSLGSAVAYTLTPSEYPKMRIAIPTTLPTQITYVTGYSMGGVPSQIIQAILKMVSTAYDLRADFEVVRGTLIEYSNNSKSLLAQFKRNRGI